MIEANFTVFPFITGDVYSTEFTFTDTTIPKNSVFRRIWNLGNGNFLYNEPVIKYTFNYPGTYNVSLTSINFDGEKSVAEKEIFVDLPFRDYVKFIEIPDEYANPGKKTKTPFKIEVLSSNPNKPLLVDLFVDNSNSVPYRFASEKWNFLTPTWKFLDKDSNIVETLSVEPVKIYKNNKVVAVSGTAEFYYVDSMSTGNPLTDCPLLITATLQTSSFSYPGDSSIYSYDSHANNQTVKSAVVWQVNDTFPTRLKITGNYLDPINKTQWKGIKIPILITCHSNRSDLIPGAEDDLSEVLFSYPVNNETGRMYEVLAAKEIKIEKNLDYLLLESLSGYILQENNFRFLLELSDTKIINITNTLTGDQYVLEDDSLYFRNRDDEDYFVGGYIFTAVTVLSTIKNAEITIQTLATNTETVTGIGFTYPQGFTPNTSVWVSNPEQNTLNKITLVPANYDCPTIQHFKTKKLLVDGNIKEIEVPKIQSSNTTNYNLSGFSGIHCIAVDPRKYDVVVSDIELDRIYKISNTGEILNTFSLSSLNDFDSKKKMFDCWSWKTPSQSLSSTNFTFYSPAFRSENFKNYLCTMDGLIWPTAKIATPYRNTVTIIAPSGIDLDFEKLNQDSYPPENIDFDVIQIFNPLLPSSYIDSVYYWRFENKVNTNTFHLTGGIPISTDTTRYIVSVDGFYYAPTTYYIDRESESLVFFDAIDSETEINIHYVGNLLLPPAYWEYSLQNDTTTLSLTGNVRYVSDENSGFLISVNKKILKPTSYTFDVNSKQLIFNQPLQKNSMVSVTQLTVTESIDIPAAYTPSHVSLDRNYNIWVTLFDSVSVLKFDKDFNLLFSTVPTEIGWEKRSNAVLPQNIDYQSSLFGYRDISEDTGVPTPDFDYFTDEFFLKPTIGETDSDNNCWVTYSNPLCSLLVKYDPDGVPLLQIPTGRFTTPTGIAIDSKNNVWVASTHGSSYENTHLLGSITQYEPTSGIRVRKITGMSRPYHLAIDRDDNLWFSQSQRRIGHYNPKTYNLYNWTLELTGGFTAYNTPTGNHIDFDKTENEDDPDIGGLAVDVYNRVWILDSLQNDVWVISASKDFEDEEIRQFKAIPNNVIGYYPDIKTGTTQIKTGDFYFKSIRAEGDWTGNRWYQKYISPAALSSVLLSGVSNKFDVFEFEDKNQIKRINESFNNAEYFKSLALPENLKNNNLLFNQFFPATVGTGYLSASEDIGQTVYEKIANFVGNHSDVDTCNVSQLLSLAEMVDEPIEDFGADLPVEVQRLIDIFSVPRPKLWGVKEQKALLPQSIGTRYNTQTDLLTAGTNIVIKNIFDNKITVQQVPIQDNNMIYPLSAFYGYGLNQPLFSNYIFYKYEPVYSEKYIENIIDWDSEYTTLSPELSNHKDWFGDDGHVERAFRYLLTKKLFH